MKKIIALTLTLLTIITLLCSCNLNNMSGAEQDAEISMLKAQIEELQNNNTVDTVEKTTPNVETTSAPKFTMPTEDVSVGNTIMFPIHYIDEFGQETNVFAVGFAVEGTFSNSATLSSELGVEMEISSRRKNNPNHIDISFVPYEYGFSSWNSADPAWTDTEYTIKVKTNEGNIYTSSGFQKKGSPRIEVKNTDEKSLINLLENNSSLIFRIEEKDKYGVPTVYLFTLSNINSMINPICDEVINSDKFDVTNSISLTSDY